MKGHRIRTCVLTAALLAATPAGAHHSFSAEYRPAQAVEADWHSRVDAMVESARVDLPRGHGKRRQGRQLGARDGRCKSALSSRLAKGGSDRRHEAHRGRLSGTEWQPDGECFQSHAARRPEALCWICRNLTPVVRQRTDTILTTFAKKRVLAAVRTRARVDRIATGAARCDRLRS